MKNSITIGITDCSKYENYHRWIASQPGVRIIKLSQHDNNLSDIEKCDGILLTGGEDVHPKFYGKPDLIARCHEIDEVRDEFELKVLDHAEQRRKPVLGICRGLQIANVFFGGTLIAHLPDEGKGDHTKLGNEDRYHSVTVEPDSLLNEITGRSSGEINSAHHQGADRIGRGLMVNARAADGSIEGLEREQRDDAFLLLVQWHPERMKDLESRFSKNIRERFLEVVKTQG